MAKLGRKGRSRPKPVMNVTPLVDVVLVLLIIFMIVIPAMEEGLNLEMPGIFNVDPERESEFEPFILTLTGDGMLMFEGLAIQREDVEEHLRRASRREPDRKLVLRGDERARYGDVRDLYGVVQNVGFPGVQLRVNERRRDSGEEEPSAARSVIDESALARSGEN
ncbi:MAG: biopolymer transporter ExbD [Myxococcota bacterium]